ncbi:importin-IPO9 [Acrasis kona]|uniref:Importin-IPO9 n=1 Tax=Acrasis kona TaxID=1008807 RepID=A0AAW2ZJ75_9EUKA
MSTTLDASVILSTLLGAMSPESETRKNSEYSLQQFAKIPGFSISLTQITVTQTSNIPSHVRQLSGIVLKRHVIEHWENLSEEEKKVVRENLPMGLTDQDTKISTSVSMAIGEIAQFDFPEKWPDLVSNLLNLFSKSDPKSAVAANSLKCLLIVSEHFNDSQIELVYPNLVPSLLNISCDSRYSKVVRSKALILMLNMLIGACEEDALKILNPTMTQMIKVITDNLSNSTQTETLIKLNSAQILLSLLIYYPQAKTNLSSVVWTNLSSGYNYYVSNVVDGANEEEYDEEGESVSFPTFITQILEVLNTMLGARRYKKQFQTIPNFCECIIGYMQLTNVDMELFKEEPNEFISNEDNLSVRDSCLNILSNYADSFGKAGTQVLIKAIGTVLVHAESRMKANQPTWWKLREAGLLALSVLHDELIEKKIPFDSKTFITNLYNLDLSSNNVYLQSRAMELISHIQEIAPQEIILEFTRKLSGILHIQTQAPIGLKLYACKAIGRLVEKDKIDPNVIVHIISGVCALSAETTHDTAHIVLDALAALIKANPGAIVGIEGNVVHVLLKLIEQYSSDPMVPSDVLNVFEKIMQTDRYSYLLPVLLPLLSSQLQNVQTIERLFVVQIMVDLTTSLVRFSNNDQQRSAILDAVFPLLINLIMDNDDPELLQCCTECLRSFIFKCSGLVVTHQLANRVTPLQSILNVVEKLLRAELNESCSMYVGDLISLLFGKCGGALDQNVTTQILVASLHKLNSASQLAITQGIVFMFAKLFITHLEQTMNLLVNTRVSDQSGLELLLTKWCENQQSYFGHYRLKVTAMGLIKLLQSANKNLDSIKITVELPDLSTSVRTRSKGPPMKQQIPFVLEAFILIVDSYARILESNLSNQKDLHAAMYGYHGSSDEDSLEDEDEFGDDYDDEDLANLVYNNQEGDEEEDDIEDHFTKDDELNKIDLVKIVPEVVKEAYAKYGQQLISGAQTFMTGKQLSTLQGMLQ